jgi:hypothetical protein
LLSPTFEGLFYNPKKKKTNKGRTDFQERSEMNKDRQHQQKSNKSSICGKYCFPWTRRIFNGIQHWLILQNSRFVGKIYQRMSK